MIPYPYGGDMTYRPKDTEERIQHRLKIAKGHLEKVIQMVNDDAYCIDILHQLQAIQDGLKSTGNLMLENHLKTCTSKAMKKGDSENAIAEIIELFKRIDT